MNDDLLKLFAALPLAVLFFVGVVAFGCSLHYSWKASKHVDLPDDELPFFLRWGKHNAIFYPHLLNPAGRQEWRKAILWLAVAFLSIIGGALYL